MAADRQEARSAATTEGGTMNLAERAMTSARAAEFTAEVREKVAAAMDAPEGEREPLLTDALESAVEALDALTSLCLAAVPPKLREDVTIQQGKLSAEKEEMWGDDGRGGSRDL